MLDNKSFRQNDKVQIHNFGLFLCKIINIVSTILSAQRVYLSK